MTNTEFRVLKWERIAEFVAVIGIKIVQYLKEHGLEKQTVRLIWILRGGAVPGLKLQRFLKRKGVNARYVTIEASYYDEETDERQDKVIVIGMEEAVKRIKPKEIVIFIDDIEESGETYSACKKNFVEEFKKQYPENGVPEYYLAVLFLKKQPDKEEQNATFWGVEAAHDVWITLPWELNKMPPDDLCRVYGLDVSRLLVEGDPTS